MSLAEVRLSETQQLREQQQGLGQIFVFRPNGQLCTATIREHYSGHHCRIPADCVDTVRQLLKAPEIVENHRLCVVFRRNWQQDEQNTTEECGNPLFERFSVSIWGGRGKVFRSSLADVADLRYWLQIQATENFSLLDEPSLTVRDQSHKECALPQQDFVRCSAAISWILQTRSVDQIQLIFLAMYFIANSFRRLLPIELVSAVYSVVDCRYSGLDDVQRVHTTLSRQQNLLSASESILDCDSDGLVNFKDSSMRKFLRTTYLPGVERGHQTFAQACLNEIRQFGSSVLARPWYKFEKWFNSQLKWPLMRYATKFWTSHYRRASKCCPSLRGEVFRMINIAVAGEPSFQTPVAKQRQVVELGYSLSKIYDLPDLSELYLDLGASGEEGLVQQIPQEELLSLKMPNDYTTPLTLHGTSPENKTHTNSLLSDSDATLLEYNIYGDINANTVGTSEAGEAEIFCRYERGNPQRNPGTAETGFNFGNLSLNPPETRHDDHSSVDCLFRSVDGHNHDSIEDWEMIDGPKTCRHSPRAPNTSSHMKWELLQWVE